MPTNKTSDSGHISDAGYISVKLTFTSKFLLYTYPVGNVVYRLITHTKLHDEEFTETGQATFEITVYYIKVYC